MNRYLGSRASDLLNDKTIKEMTKMPIKRGLIIRDSMDFKARDGGWAEATLYNVDEDVRPNFNDPGILEDILIFKFKFVDGNGECWLKCKRTESKLGKLFKTLKMLAGGSFLEIFEGDATAMMKLINGLEGARFSVLTEPSEDGKWNNFMSAMPLGMTSQAQAKATQEALIKKERNFDDDDIPF